MADNMKQLKKHLSSGIKNRSGIRAWLKNIDMLITERAMLDASGELLKTIKGSRGSIIKKQKEKIDLCHFGPDSAGKKTKDFVLDGKSLTDMVIETWLDKEGDAHSEFVPVRPLPEPDVWFEAVWARFVKGEVFES
jgi:hypothetical protein